LKLTYVMLALYRTRYAVSARVALEAWTTGRLLALANRLGRTVPGAKFLGTMGSSLQAYGILRAGRGLRRAGRAGGPGAGIGRRPGGLPGPHGAATGLVRASGRARPPPEIVVRTESGDACAEVDAAAARAPSAWSPASRPQRSGPTCCCSSTP